MSVWDSGIVVCTVDALMDKLEAYEKFKSNAIRISEQDSINLEELCKKLVGLGYDRVDEVEGIGQFAVRGGIIDIFPLTGEYPFRVELWGDEIDSIRSFDIVTQRSIETKESLSVYPAKEKELGGSCSFLSLNYS